MTLTIDRVHIGIGRYLTYTRVGQISILRLGVVARHRMGERVLWSHCFKRYAMA